MPDNTSYSYAFYTEAIDLYYSRHLSMRAVLLEMAERHGSAPRRNSLKQQMTARGLKPRSRVGAQILRHDTLQKRRKVIALRRDEERGTSEIVRITGAPISSVTEWLKQAGINWDRSTANVKRHERERFERALGRLRG